MVLVFAICFAPGMAVLIVIRRQQHGRLSRNATPFQELRRRPAGEGLRIKIAGLDEKLDHCIGLLVLLPALVAMASWFVRAAMWITLGPSIVISAIWAAVLGFRLNRISREREDYRLGFDGERFVGEELSRLIAHGYEVWHDVPFDGFNIDHVLVGPPGVFSVETKTRRKPVSDSRGKEFHVEFDGSCLRWPWGTDTYGLHQAENNAKTLAQWLSSAVGDPVVVTAVLTLPGWMVDRRAPPGAVHVLNPKEIIKLCTGREEKLSENLIKRVRHQLDQKCRLEVE